MSKVSDGFSIATDASSVQIRFRNNECKGVRIFFVLFQNVLLTQKVYATPTPGFFSLGKTQNQKYCTLLSNLIYLFSSDNGKCNNQLKKIHLLKYVTICIQSKR